MDIKQLQAEKKRSLEFAKWRKSEADKMPDLALRVFALRPNLVNQKELEKLLGTCIRELNNHCPYSGYYGKDAEANRIVLEVLVEELYGDVEKAEKVLGLSSQGH